MQLLVALSFGALMVVCAVRPAGADLTTEYFDYGAAYAAGEGPLDLRNGGEGWGSAWTSGDAVWYRTGSLIWRPNRPGYSNYGNDPNQGHAGYAASGTARRAFAQPFQGAVWFSLVVTDAPGPGDDVALSDAVTGAQVRFGLDERALFIDLPGLAVPRVVGSIGGGANGSDPHLVVGKLEVDYDTAGNDRLQLWVDPQNLLSNEDDQANAHALVEGIDFLAGWSELAITLQPGNSVDALRFSYDGPSGPGGLFEALFGSCGNGRLDAGEVCDDGNVLSCDGCSASCRLEGGCGDGILDPVCEDCDDGNTEDGDCCASVCVFEPALSVCGGNDGVCQFPGSCDGAGSCVGSSSRDCNDGDLCTEDLCDPAGDPNDPCSNVSSSAACEDGDACTRDTCDADAQACVQQLVESCAAETDAASVPAGDPTPVPVLGGSEVPGGVDVSFESSNGGTFTAERVSTSLEDLESLSDTVDGIGQINFGLITEPALLYDFSFDGSFTGFVTLVVGYDEAAILSPFTEENLALFRFKDGVWVKLEGTVDTIANTVTAVTDGFSEFTLGGEGSQTTNQSKCINELNKLGARIAKAKGKQNYRCVKDRTKGKVMSAEDCISGTDAKVEKAKSKIREKFAAKCTNLEEPFFGTTDPNTQIEIMITKELELIHDIFGSNLDVAIVSVDLNKPLAKCQAEAAKRTVKCQDTELKVFNRCKKNAVAGKAPFEPVTTAEALQDACMQEDPNDPGSGIPDPKGKITKACSTKLSAKLVKRCTGVELGDAFPGECQAAADTAELAVCLHRRVECRVCLALNGVDNLARDCDEFDDGLDNDSCP